MSNHRLKEKKRWHFSAELQTLKSPSAEDIVGVMVPQEHLTPLPEEPEDMVGERTSQPSRRPEIRKRISGFSPPSEYSQNTHITQ